MHYFIFPTKDSWISSGSNKIDGTSFTDQNFGKDQILELKKEFYDLSYDYSTRILLQWNLTDLNTKIGSGLIPSGSSVKYYLRLFEAEGNKELSTNYTLIAHPLSQSWDEGTGKYIDSPIVKNGVSWKYRENKPNGSAVTWTNNSTNQIYGGNFMTASIGCAQSADEPTSGSQVFSYESTDVDMDVTRIVNHWLDNRIPNNGLIVKFSGSQETDNTTFGQLKFFSSDTHTVYSPRLEVRWDDSTGYPSTTGSMVALDLTGGTDIHLYMKGLRDSYRETDKVKFRVGARERIVQKTFSNSYAVNSLTGSYIQSGSGSYSIVDTATGETIVPFSAYTSMSVDTTSNYFIQYMNGFHPDRVYRILYKVKFDDGQEIIYDDDFDFKIKRV